MNAKKVPLFDILFAKTEIKIQTKFVGLVQSNVHAMFSCHDIVGKLLTLD